MQTSPQVHRIETTVGQGGVLMLDHLPFAAGQAVEVIILPQASTAQPADRYPLRGAAVDYRQPLLPVDAEDWGVTR